VPYSRTLHARPRDPFMMEAEQLTADPCAGCQRRVELVSPHTSSGRESGSGSFTFLRSAGQGLDWTLLVMTMSRSGGVNLASNVDHERTAQNRRS